MAGIMFGRSSHKIQIYKLYNAVNDSHYTNPEELEITTMNDVVYMGMKNDLSFIIGDEMNLYEHQSSFSPNLPLRGFLYFAALYRTYSEPIKQRLYMESPLYIPFPQYIVFYNGTKEETERQEVKMSNLFVGNGKTNSPVLECIAVEEAVDECIKKGILVDILRKNRSEVLEMILEEWNENEFRELLKEESWKEGRKEGIQEGIVGMIKICKEFHLPKEEVLLRIQREFSLEEKEAEAYLQEY